MVKLVKDEPESAALWNFISGASLAGSELLVTEVPRALRRPQEPDQTFDLTRSLRQADVPLGVVGLKSIGRLTLWRAGRLFEPRLRSLDAIHVMTALEILPIETFVSYDIRQVAAARAAGLPTASPGVKK